MRASRYLLIVAFLAAVGPIILSAQDTGKRSALLIANGAYRNFGSLANPVPETRRLAGALRGLGFAVTLVENASREAMLDALADFEAGLKKTGGIAWFQYSGHGVQANGKNYLIPADADIPDERRLGTRAVDVEEIMASLDASGSSTNIVVLDACRNNPLPAVSGKSATKGLDVVGLKPKNSIIVYAAESNMPAFDGVFTPALIQAITRPGLSLSEVMMEVRSQVHQKTNGAQTPGEYNQLFKPRGLLGQRCVEPAVSVSRRLQPGQPVHQPRLGLPPCPPSSSVTSLAGAERPQGAVRTRPSALLTMPPRDAVVRRAFRVSHPVGHIHGRSLRP